MAGRFDYFILLAEMRTGSNFLEENVNEYSGLHCYGEVYNPHFIGHARQKELMGISLADREADPLRLLKKICEQTDGTPGFRFFHDHDPRVLEHCLADRRCAKVILTRNPLDSYISLKIAAQTGQWRLRDMKYARSATVRFDGIEFERHLDRLQAFQLRLQHGLQGSGQTAFYIGYDDLHDIEVLNGLARYLGAEGEKKAASNITKVQNPSGFEEKVTNYSEMQSVLARIDRFDLSRTPNFEPRRGPAVPAYVAAETAPVLFMPLHTGLEQGIEEWLASLDGGDTDKLQRKFTQKTLRQWKRRHTPHRSLAVVRHPVARLYGTFAALVLPPGVKGFADIRETLRGNYKVPLPGKLPEGGIDAKDARKAFLAFAGFVKGNLGGQTSVRVDPHWASQDMLLQGMTRFAAPDMILREDGLDAGLSHLCGQIGLKNPGWSATEPPAAAPALAEIYDADVEAAVRSIYQRDYMTFGFSAWGA